MTITSYSGMHRKIRRLRGDATQHACTVCGGVAEEWALVAQPDAADDGGRYSLNLDDYEPMCRSCHRRRDDAGRPEWGFKDGKCQRGLHDITLPGATKATGKGSRRCRACSNDQERARRRAKAAAL